MPKKKQEQPKRSWNYNLIKGDVIKLWKKELGWLVIPTNLNVNKKGEAVMGAGVAKQIASEVPKLPLYLGKRIKVGWEGLQVFPSLRLIALPTKYDFKDFALPSLISLGLAELNEVVENDRKHYGGRINHVYVPALGCGAGGLKWNEVEPLFKEWLGNSSYFTIVLTEEMYEQIAERSSDEERRRTGKF